MTYLQNQNGYFSEPEEEPYILSNLFLLELMPSKHGSCFCDVHDSDTELRCLLRPDRHSKGYQDPAWWLRVAGRRQQAGEELPFSSGQSSCVL